MKLSQLYNISKKLLDKYGDLDIGELMCEPFNFKEYAKFHKVIELQYVDKNMEKDYTGKPFINLYIGD